MALMAEIMFWCQKASSNTNADVPGIFTYLADDKNSTESYMRRRNIQPEMPQFSNKKPRFREWNLATLTEHLRQHRLLDFAWHSSAECDIFLSNAELIRINQNPHNLLQPMHIRAESVNVPLISSYITASIESPASTNTTWFHNTTIANSSASILVAAKFSSRSHNILIGVLNSSDIMFINIEHWHVSLSLEKKLRPEFVQRFSLGDCERNTSWASSHASASKHATTTTIAETVALCLISFNKNETLVAVYMKKQAGLSTTGDYVDPYKYYKPSTNSVISARNHQHAIYVFHINDKSTALAEKRALRTVCKIYREWMPFSVEFSNVDPPEKLFIFEHCFAGDAGGGVCQARLSSFLISTEKGGSSVRLNSMVLDLPGSSVIASCKNPLRDMWALYCGGSGTVKPLVLATFDPGMNLLSSIELSSPNNAVSNSNVYSEGLSCWQWLPCGAQLSTISARGGELKLYDFALQHVSATRAHHFQTHEPRDDSETPVTSLRLVDLLAQQTGNFNSADLVASVLWNPHSTTYADYSAIIVFKSGICGVLQITWGAPKLGVDLHVDSRLLFEQASAPPVAGRNKTTALYDFSAAVRHIVRQYLYNSSTTSAAGVDHTDPDFALNQRRLAYQKIYNCLRRLSLTRGGDGQLCFLLINETFYSALRQEPFDMVEYNACDQLLGLFYAPVQPHSESVLIKYAFQMRHLARMLTVRLLGVGKLDLAYKLAHNMKDIDLISTIRALAAQQQQHVGQQQQLQNQNHNFAVPRLLRSADTRVNNTHPPHLSIQARALLPSNPEQASFRARRSSFHEHVVNFPASDLTSNVNRETQNLTRLALHGSTELLNVNQHFRTSSDASAAKVTVSSAATMALISPINRRRPISFAPDSVVALDDLPGVFSNV